MSKEVDAAAASAARTAASDLGRTKIEAWFMWDLSLMIAAGGLRVIHALISGHETSVLAIASSVAQMVWFHLRGGRMPPSRWPAVAQIVRIGLCGVVLAALPPGSRLVILLLDRAARSAASSKLRARICSLKLAGLAPTSRLVLGKLEP